MAGKPPGNESVNNQQVLGFEIPILIVDVSSQIFERGGILLSLG